MNYLGFKIMAVGAIVWGMGLVGMQIFHDDQPSEYHEYVKRVLDGDTIELDNGTVVRYIGIDAPETVDPWKPVECYGEQASSLDKRYMEGEYVKVVVGEEPEDSYGRTLAYVFANEVEEINVGLVRRGAARVDTVGDNKKNEQKYIDAQQYAITHDEGLWRVCGLR